METLYNLRMVYDDYHEDFVVNVEDVMTNLSECLAHMDEAPHPDEADEIVSEMEFSEIIEKLKEFDYIVTGPLSYEDVFQSLVNQVRTMSTPNWEEIWEDIKLDALGVGVITAYIANATGNTENIMGTTELIRRLDIAARGDRYVGGLVEMVDLVGVDEWKEVHDRWL